MELEPIGVVRNGIREARDEAWSNVVSEIRLRSELAAGLRGLEEFSHVLVLFHMHEAAFKPEDHLLRRPWDRADMPVSGIFAQRARHRPNPIGSTTAALDRVEGSSVFVRGLDAIDGTPVLDLKPHVPVFGSPSAVRQPEWILRLMRGYF